MTIHDTNDYTQNVVITADVYITNKINSCTCVVNGVVGILFSGGCHGEISNCIPEEFVHMTIIKVNIPA